jgi:tripartite-type tricarboxylate transporter receptor subunit TctC
MYGSRFIITAAMALLATVTAVSAESKYPAKPIKVIVPFAAGNTADILARVLGEHVGRQLRTTLVVENRPGAESILGSTLAAKAPADGYTIMLGSTSGLAAAPALRENLSYDPISDFEPVTQVTRQSYVLVVKPEFPANSIADLIEMAKSQPGKFTFGSSNTTTRVASELFRSMAGIQMTNVPYSGTDQAIQDLLNGQITMFFAGSLTATPHIERKALKPLAVSTETRLATLPDVPALNETVPGYSFYAWHALVAPKGTPSDIIATLNGAFRKAMQDTDVLSKLMTAGGSELQPSTPEELRQLMARDVVQWRTIVKQANIPVAN